MRYSTFVLLGVLAGCGTVIDSDFASTKPGCIDANGCGTSGASSSAGTSAASGASNTAGTMTANGGSAAHDAGSGSAGAADNRGASGSAGIAGDAGQGAGTDPDASSGTSGGGVSGGGASGSGASGGSAGTNSGGDAGTVSPAPSRSPASPGFLYAVRIRTPNGNCTGSLVSNAWVITARGCAERASQASIVLEYTDDTDQIVQQRGVDEIVPFPIVASTSAGRDVALVRSDAPFTVSGMDNSLLVPYWPYFVSNYSDPNIYFVCVGFGHGDVLEQVTVSADHEDPNATFGGVALGDRVWLVNHDPGDALQRPRLLGGDYGASCWWSNTIVSFHAAIYEQPASAANPTLVPSLGLSENTLRAWYEGSLTGTRALSFTSASDVGAASDQAGTVMLGGIDENGHATVSSAVAGVTSMPTDLGVPNGETLISERPALAHESLHGFALFARSASGKIFYKTNPDGNWDADWSEAPNGGFAADSALTVTSWGRDRWDLFARGSSGDLLHAYYDGGWGPSGESWGMPSSTTLASAPAATSWGEQELQIVAAGVDGAVWHFYYPSGIWESLGGSNVVEVATTTYQVGRLDVFSRTNTGRLQHRWYQSTFIDFWQDVATSTPPSSFTATSAWPGSYSLITRSSGKISELFLPR